MLKPSSKTKLPANPLSTSSETEFECLKKFTALEEYISELEKGGPQSENPLKAQSEENNKSEWYRYAEGIMQSEKVKKKPLPEIPFDELLGYWMKQGV